MEDLSKIICAALILSFLFNVGLLIAQCGPYFPPDASNKGVSKIVIGFIPGSYELVAFTSGFIVPRYLGLFNYNYSCLTGNFLYIFGYLMFGFTTFINEKGLYSALALSSMILIGLGASVSYATLFPILFSLLPQYKSSVTSAVPLALELGSFIGPLLGSLLFSIGGFFLPFAVISLFAFICLIFTCIFILHHQNQSDHQITSDLQKKLDDKIEEVNLPLKESVKPKLWNFIKKPEIILASIPFALFNTTRGLFSVFLAPYLDNVMGIKDDLIGLYFTPISLMALIASPVFGCLINWKLKWFSFIVSPVIGLLSSSLLGCSYFVDSFRSNQIIIPALFGFGFCSSVGFISGMVVLDELFQINKEKCLEDGTRMLMSSWTQNICYFLGRWMGTFLIGGLIFEHLGYAGVLIAQILLHLISTILTSLCFIQTAAKTKALTLHDSQNLSANKTDEQMI